MLAVPVVTTNVGSARAERVTVRVGGSVRIGAGGEVRVRRHRHHRRHRAHARVRVGGGLYFGLRFAEPPPPPPRPVCDTSCGTVPAYYTGYAAPPPRQNLVVQVPERDLPRWGLGVFAGSVDVDGKEAGSDLGVLGRFRLSDHVELDAEIAKSELASGGRVDRRIGLALLYDFDPLSTWSLHALAGAGYGRTEMDEGTLHAQQGYGELGLGLTYRITDRFHLAGDLRFGRRHTADDVALRVDDPTLIDDREDYSRFRLGGLLYF